MRTINELIEQEGESRIIDAFHNIWYNSKETWATNIFLGLNILQLPFDLQIYQEVIYKIKPDFILQTGISAGGSLLYFAALLDIMKIPNAPVIGIDIKLMDSAKNLNNPRIKVFEGSSIDPIVVAKATTGLHGNGLVILDSDHSEQHVFAEINIYNKYVGIGSYLVVEDTNINNHPVLSTFGPGPFEAVDKFLKINSEFVNDELWKRNKFSFHQNGWLRRIK
jgi:cephalosporin hydroxylase